MRCRRRLACLSWVVSSPGGEYAACARGDENHRAQNEGNTMPPSLQVTFRNLLPSEPVITLVRDHALRLSDEHQQLVGCHAIVAADPDAHCRVKLELNVREGRSFSASLGVGVSELEKPDDAVLRAFANARTELARYFRRWKSTHKNKN